MQQNRVQREHPGGRWFTFVLISLGLVYLMAASLPAETRDIRHEIPAAETYYHLGIAEKGNLDAYTAGLSHLAVAESLLTAAGTHGTEDTTAVRQQIHALRQDLLDQIDLNHDTFFGVFPLVRMLLTGSASSDATSATYEMVDDPASVAVSQGARRLASLLVDYLPYDAQFPVVITSFPRNTPLEHEAVFVFGTMDRFRVIPTGECAGLLTPIELAQLETDTSTPDIVRKVGRSAGTDRVIHVAVREQDSAVGVLHYIMTGTIYHTDTEQPVGSTFRVRSLCRDRRTATGDILSTVGVLALLATIFVIADLLIRRQPGGLLLLPGITIAVGAFVAGILIPWLVRYALTPLAPAADVLAVRSFWWTCLAGAAIVGLPFLVFQLASARIGGPVARVMEDRSGVFAAIVGAGVSAHLMTPVLLYDNGDLYATTVPLILTITAMLYTLGSAVDHTDDFPRWTILPVSLLLLCAGPALLHHAPEYLWLIAGLNICVLLAGIILERWGTRWLHPAHPRTPVQAGVPTTVPELIHACTTPVFREISPAYSRAWEGITPALNGKTSWLPLEGERGSGKSATADTLIKRLQSTLAAQGKRTLLMKGTCLNSIGPRKPFTPFQQALGKQTGVTLAGTDSGGSNVDSALLGLVDSFVPLAGLLLPALSGGADRHTSQDELFESVASAIRRLTRKHTIILFIEDIQWIDDASRDLLRFLLRSFPRGGNMPFILFLTASSAAYIEALGITTGIISISPPTDAEKTVLLADALGLERDTAERIVSESAPGSAAGGHLLWLFEVVSYLAETGALEHAAEGFTLTESFRHADALPLPESLDESIGADLQKEPEYRHILECAACIGLRFPVSILANGVDIPRLHLLQHLTDIQYHTGLVRDVESEDDMFAFNSSLVLETIRNRAHINGHGPAGLDVPQLIREYHARIAEGYEATIEQAPDNVFIAARQWYAAGTKHAEKGYELTLRASDAALSMYRYEEARRFLEMAGECAAAAGLSPALDERFSLVDEAQRNARQDTDKER